MLVSSITARVPHHFQRSTLGKVDSWLGCDPEVNPFCRNSYVGGISPIDSLDCMMLILLGGKVNKALGEDGGVGIVVYAFRNTPLAVCALSYLQE